MIGDEPCWDPVAVLPAGEPETSFRGRWEDRLWLNVPGPFYTGMTDNCWTGRLHAPRHVLYGGDCFGEYVYRQPVKQAEVLSLVEAAQDDPFYGYACDGDRRWTPESVRDWWRDRARVVEYLESLLPTWSCSDNAEEREAAGGWGTSSPTSSKGSKWTFGGTFSGSRRAAIRRVPEHCLIFGEDAGWWAWSLQDGCELGG